MIPKELRDAMAAIRGSEDGILTEDNIELSCPISATIAEEIRKRWEESQLYTGNLIEDQGIYLGKYEPKDRQGKKLGKVFHVFAAPEDLKTVPEKRETFTYSKAVEIVATLKNWHGYDGTPYKNDEEIYQALKDGTYNGGWIIPPRELLAGSDLRGWMNAQKDNLYTHQDNGAFTGTFSRVEKRVGVSAESWYWSSTYHPSDFELSWYARFADRYSSWNHIKNYKMSCRLVRLVECKRP